MKKVIFLLLAIPIELCSCTRDPSVNDLKSPCAAAETGIYLDNPCVKRIPVENIGNSSIIAYS